MAAEVAPYVIRYFNTSSPTEILIFQLMKCYINPIMSIFGLASNGLSAAILCKSGLRKPSNILLLSLAVADSMCMMFTMDIPEILAFFDPHKTYPEFKGWQYDYVTAYFLFSIHSVISLISNWGCYVNTYIPVLITLERLVAIFCPLTFKKVVTTKTVLVSVTLCFLVWLPLFTFEETSTIFSYINLTRDRYMGVAMISDFYEQHADLMSLLYTYAFDVLASWVPIALVCTGCLVIGIKIRMTLSNRRELLTNTRKRIKWSVRTTRTLLCTCLIFSVANIVYFFMNYILDLDYVNMDHHAIECEVVNFIYLLNCSSNFFVYVVFNNKFRVIFIEMVRTFSRQKFENTFKRRINLNLRS